MLKKHMSPLTKGGQLHKHVGKGAVEKPLTPTPSSAGMPTMGPSYSKPDPDAQQSDNDQDDMGPSMGGI